MRARSARFDLAAGDFDDDGIDERALVATEAFTVANGISIWSTPARRRFQPAITIQAVEQTRPVPTL
ncbi:MAG TPA: hypothetical protein PLX89_03440 [Verrucomicrobiota bacterium]|nr:hypothetical protein [Verrucomicrobiota bacterium]